MAQEGQGRVEGDAACLADKGAEIFLGESMPVCHTAFFINYGSAGKAVTVEKRGGLAHGGVLSQCQRGRRHKRFRRQGVEQTLARAMKAC